jgi:hypothetical protein
MTNDLDAISVFGRLPRTVTGRVHHVPGVKQTIEVGNCTGNPLLRRESSLGATDKEELVISPNTAHLRKRVNHVEDR